ncbi:hypothetical protein BOX15_Mlig003574g1, partial [Macrostomum lignano]
SNTAKSPLTAAVASKTTKPTPTSPSAPGDDVRARSRQAYISQKHREQNDSANNMSTTSNPAGGDTAAGDSVEVNGSRVDNDISNEMEQLTVSDPSDHFGSSRTDSSVDSLSTFGSPNRLYPDLSAYGYGTESMASPSPSPSQRRGKVPPRYRERKSAQEENESKCLYIVIGLLVVVFAYILGARAFLTSGSKHTSNCTLVCIKTVVQRDLAGKFPAQSARLWSTISACLTRQYGSSTPVDAPSVLMLFSRGVGSGGVASSQLTLNFLVGRLSRLLASGIGECGCRTFSKAEKDGCSEVEAKTAATTELIDAAATEAARSKRSCLAIHRIDQLTGPASLIFYRLADSTEAPHRPFLYILTVEGDAAGEKVVDETSLQRQLRQTWVSTGLQTEHFDPMWARIGGNVVAVLPESDDTLHQLSRS